MHGFCVWIPSRKGSPPLSVSLALTHQSPPLLFPLQIFPKCQNRFPIWWVTPLLLAGRGAASLARLLGKDRSRIEYLSIVCGGIFKTLSSLPSSRPSVYQLTHLFGQNFMSRILVTLTCLCMRIGAVPLCKSRITNNKTSPQTRSISLYLSDGGWKGFPF